ncbi:MAG: sensor histidine kinase [Candidatus Dormibacteraeota bacterium]|uniref:Sensor histidine kinase n=1 Tax=Candidatus Aeolococcus gillhamiae TaxID=3127015 RepID=A0A2W6ARB8_9BACT|nr:sensor histidine kinase [Candidatus Dormibacteraeota bacterium]PZR80331.1 MAG: hypothetical protein DLM65_08455 [Candidatus Dormibacter sp. RRmetagenome_bin12]
MEASRTLLQRRPLLVWVCLVAGGAAGELLQIANHATWQSPTQGVGLGTLFVLTYGLAGVLILSRQPGNQVGRIFLYLTVGALITQLTSEYAIYAYLTTRSALPLRELVAWLSQWVFFTAFPVGLSMVFLFFPDGLKQGRTWRAVLVLAVVGSAVLTLAFMLTKGHIAPADRGVVGNLFLPVNNPTGVLVDPDNGIAAMAQTAGWFLSGAALILAVVAAVLRLFQSSGERREQLKWVGFVAAPVAPAFAVHFIDLAVFNGAFPDVAGPLYLAIFLVGLPAAMAVAILKYRLYGIDVVISRALVYSALALFITGVYVGIAVGVGAIAGGGGKPNLALSIVATAIVAVGFQPVRERMQRVANRLVYGERATPYEVLAQFSERVAESYTTEDVMPRMARVLAEGTGAQRADVWLRSSGTWREVAVWPVDAPRRDAMAAKNGTLPSVDGGVIVPVRHQGDLLGALSVAKRIGETLTPVEENLLSHLASQAGLVLKNVGLTGDLQARLVDLRASRQRLVTAQDEERRRLERNLHDGAQQHLVALKVKIGLAEMLMARDPEKAMTTLGQLKRDADEALETLRDLARGIFPPLLADKGLEVALQSQARKATLAVTVHAAGIGRYSQETEAAVYFCCLEALQNIQKYARATEAVIQMRDESGELRFEITDDGVGFDVTATKKGAGLVNMADRFDALGGEITVTSAVGSGTTIAGRLRVATT